MGILRMERLCDGFNVIQLIDGEHTVQTCVVWLPLPGPLHCTRPHTSNQDCEMPWCLYFISFCFLVQFFPLSLHLNLSPSPNWLVIGILYCVYGAFFARIEERCLDLGNHLSHGGGRGSSLPWKVLCMGTWVPDLLLFSVYSELKCEECKLWGKGIFSLMLQEENASWEIRSIFFA